MLAEWNLTDEEIETIKDTDIGAEIHIETEVKPILFMSEDEKTMVICAYTSRLEIGKEWYLENAVQQVSWSYIEILVESIQVAIGKHVEVRLDYDSKDWLIITDKMLKVQ